MINKEIKRNPTLIMKAPQETAYEFVADSVNSSKEMSKESTIFKHTEPEFED